MSRLEQDLNEIAHCWDQWQAALSRRDTEMSSYWQIQYEARLGSNRVPATVN